VKTPVFYTYSVWTQRVQNLAYALLKAGLKPGDRLAVVAPNTPMMADALQGSLAARVILTPINIRLTPQEVAYILGIHSFQFLSVSLLMYLIPRT
jgi:acyl-CoA synthetase (AMP-forming)/AMP-acid ligase II